MFCEIFLSTIWTLRLLVWRIIAEFLPICISLGTRFPGDLMVKLCKILCSLLHVMRYERHRVLFATIDDDCNDWCYWRWLSQLQSSTNPMTATERKGKVNELGQRRFLEFHRFFSREFSWLTKWLKTQLKIAIFNSFVFQLIVSV